MAVMNLNHVFYCCLYGNSEQETIKIQVYMAGEDAELLPLYFTDERMEQNGVEQGIMHRSRIDSGNWWTCAPHVR